MPAKTTLVLLAAAAALLLWPAPALADDPAGYRQALAETLRAAEDAISTLPPSASLAGYGPLGQALDSLESIDRVTTETGAVVTVDNRDLIRRLRGTPDEGHRASETLRQLLRAVDRAYTEAQIPAAEARSALDEVLARPDFRKAGPNPFSQFLDSLGERLSDWLNAIVRGLLGWLGGWMPNVSLPQSLGDLLGQAISVGFRLILGAAAIFAVVFFVLTWRSSRPRLQRYATLGTAAGRDPDDARDARLAAQKAADEGDYRRAVHYLYLWAVLHLTEKSELRFDRSLTNREQIRALSPAGEVAELLRTAVDSFDRIWYGHAGCTVVEYGTFRDSVERIVGFET